MMTDGQQPFPVGGMLYSLLAAELVVVCNDHLIIDDELQASGTDQDIRSHADIRGWHRVALGLKLDKRSLDYVNGFMPVRLVGNSG